MRRSRQASCFCEKHKVSALLENLVDPDGVYFCSWGTNTISHSYFNNPLFLHYFSDTAKFDGYCQGS